MDFYSDNVTGACPEILAALVEANQGSVASYGADPWTQGLDAAFAELFEREVAVFPIATGTAANALALSLLTPPYGAVYCHRDAHIEVDECGAPEFYGGGARLVPLDGAAGRITAADLAATLANSGAGVQHHVQPAAISLTQATESGTVYRADDIAAIAELARSHGLGLHMDGARFANAVAFLGCAPADITWRAGVDVLSFGATKNGAMAAEAVVVFDPDRATDFLYRRKRGGHLFSKMRFLSAQLAAYLKDGLWLRNATHANAQAARLADGLAALPGIELVDPVEANEVFLRLPEPVAQGLTAAGFGFHPWAAAGPDAVRLVTAYNTDPGDVDALIAAAAGLCGAA